MVLQWNKHFNNSYHETQLKHKEATHPLPDTATCTVHVLLEKLYSLYTKETLIFHLKPCGHTQVLVNHPSSDRSLPIQHRIIAVTIIDNTRLIGYTVAINLLV